MENERKREERRNGSLRKSDQNAPRSEASSTTSLTTGRRSTSMRLPVVRVIQRHLWECNLFWLSVSPIPPHSPPTTVIDYYFNITQHHTSLREEWKQKRLLSPSLLSHEGKGFKKWGRAEEWAMDGARGRGVWRLSWRPDLAWWTFL